jgi:hypothetical protein
MHLLYLSFALAVHKRAGDDAALARSIATKQLIGLAGLAGERIHRALGLPGGVEGALRVMELHPLFNPAVYVVADFESDRVHLHLSPAHDDQAWPALVSPGAVAPLQAIASAVDPHLRVEISGTPTDWTALVTETDSAAEEFAEVAVTKFSGGSSFVFQPRKSLPLTPV